MGLSWAGGVIMSGKISVVANELVGVGLVLHKPCVQASMGLYSLYLTSGTIVEAELGHGSYSTRLPGVERTAAPSMFTTQEWPPAEGET